MNLDDLSAAELAELDDLCLEFERRFGTADALSIDEVISGYVDKSSGSVQREKIGLLRTELRAIATELNQKRADEVASLRSVPTPFQPKTNRRDRRPPPDPTASSGDVATKWQPSGGTSAARESSSEVPNPPTPESIGPYSVGCILARGGMGIVYRATDTRLDRDVAIKMLGFPHLSPTDPKRIELVERFEREAKAVANLSHPNIVELFDVGVVGNVPYAVMEYLGGRTLADQLERGPIPIEETRQIGLQIAGALATAHAAGVIHRDLKPQNVMLVDGKDSDAEVTSRVKLLDFGLSRVSDAAFEGDGEQPNQTRSGAILGTPGYMAPEQARGEPATTAADMFGLGCLLYEVFHGKPAIPGETPADRLAGTLRGEVEQDRSQCEKSKVLCEMISECLRKDPLQRPTATDVYSRLRSFDLALADKPGDRHSLQPRPQHDHSNALLRRHVLTTLVGGAFGGLFGGFVLGKSTPKLDGVRSIAVLTLRDASVAGSATVDNGMPLADRKLSDGEILSSALVSELSAIDGLAVLPYQPKTAETPTQFVELGQQLGVDVFLTGQYETQTLGQQNFWVLNWQLVSATDGSVLDGKEFVIEQEGNNGGGQFLSQSMVASDVAKQIGKTLVTSGQKQLTPDPMAYGCMMKGHAYADADSTVGLRMALRCFDHAHEEDPRLSEPLASIAVASLNLAARGDSAEESLQHLAKAHRSMTEALELDPDSINARLAEAMIQWQSLHHYDEAFRLFNELQIRQRYQWQIHHQRGLLLTALGMGDDAIDALRTASKLNPMSILVKTDLCRARWFFGQGERAIRDATRYHEELRADHPARNLILGFLVDFYENNRDYAKAAEHCVDLPASSNAASSNSLTNAGQSNAEQYYKLRSSTLASIPYGPFGSVLNQTIFDVRVNDGLDEGILGRLDDSGATMFPLVFAQHPAFATLRSRPESAGYLPSLETRYPTA